MGSVLEEISRLETAKQDIETAIEYCGVNVPDTELIDSYADYIKQIPSAVFSTLNADLIGGTDKFISSIKQTNGIIEATAGGLVSASASGLAPKIGTEAAATITTAADEWVLTSTKGATPTWRKLPANAFKNDDSDTTYSAGTGISLSGTTFSNAGVRSTTINGNYLRVNTNGTNTDLTIPYATSANSANSANYFVGCNNSIMVEGDANTYYPVVIPTTLSKNFQNIITVWKNLGTTTASYTGNHSNGTASMIYRYDVRNSLWDGNGGYCVTLDARYMYAPLVAETTMLGSGVGNFCIWLRGGGTEYKISTSWALSSTDIKVYYSSTNVGSTDHPVNVASRTTIGNAGIYNSITIPCSVRSASSATTATKLDSNAGSATNPIYFSGGKPAACTYSLNKTVPADALFTDTALGKTFKTLSSASHTGWTNITTDDKIIPTMSFMAYWNGAYNSSGSSNLGYCNQGAFGAAATKSTTTSVTSGSTALVTSGGVYSFVTGYAGISKTGTVTSITLTAGSGISINDSGTAITTSGTRTITNTGVRSTTINGDYLRVNTNGTNADLTIPYAVKANKLNSASLKSTSGLHYFYAGGITTSTDNTGEYAGPSSSTIYSSVLRLQSHTTAGALYYRDLIFDVNNDSIWSRRVTNSGTPSLVSILHSGNSSVSKSGQTLTVKINGVELSLTNTTYTSLKNPNAIKFKNTSGTEVSYDGSAAVDLTSGINYATSAGSAGSATTAQGAYYVFDYNATTSPIYIGFASTGLTSTTANYLAAYGTTSAGKRCIKDISAAEAKKFIGLGNVTNYDLSKAITSITRSGLTFTYTCLDGTTGTFSQQDNNTWRGITDSYAGTDTNISLSQKGGNALYTLISDLEDNLADNFAVSGGGSTWGSSLSVTINGITKTLTIPSNPNTDTKNTAGSTNTSSKIFLIGATSQAANPQTYSHDTAYVGTDGCLYSNSTKVSVDGHGHSYLKGWSDTRSAATTPNDYNGLFKVVGIKNAGTTLGLTSTQAGSYATIIGWRGWTDSSGGYSWEIASTDKNRLYTRSGSTTSWNNGWNLIAYVSDIPTKTSQLTNDSGFITSRGYLGTTAIQASSAALAVTGVTTLNMSNTLTITGGGMRVTGAAYFGGGTTYYFGSTGNVNCNTLTAASTTIIKGSFLLWNSTNSYISFYNNGKTSSNLVAQIHGMAGYNTTSATYTSGTNIYFRIYSSAVNGTTISTAGYYDYIFPNVPQGLTARTVHTIFTTQQSSYTLNGTGGSTDDVALTFWRGSNASWLLLNTGGNLRFKYNYYDNKVNTVYKDALVLNYSTGKVCSPTGFYEESDERLKDFYNDVEVNLEKLIQLPKKYFRWKRDPLELNIGTSAQEVLKLYPELVTQNDEGILSVAYDKLSIIALKGIDLLYKEIKELKVRIELLENK